MSFDYSAFFREEEDPDDEYLEQQYQEFFEVIRIQLIILLLVTVLCFIASYIISHYRNVDLNSEVPSTRQDRLTYWVAIKLCMFGLAIAIGIALLLPLTIVCNEFILRTNQLPEWSWLNDKLIKQLWSYIFIFSNLCFLLIPFSYFFAESTGFSRSTDNFCSRILQAIVETQLTLTIILSCLILGLSTVFPIFQPNFLQLLTFWLNFPFLYSCISFTGALLLLVCTPKGILNLIVILNEKLTKPYRVTAATEQHELASIRETVLRSRQRLMERANGNSRTFLASSSRSLNSKEYDDLATEQEEQLLRLQNRIDSAEGERTRLYAKLSASWLASAAPWLLYPLAMALIIATTAFSGAIVLFNMLGLLFQSFRSSGQDDQLLSSSSPFVLGIASISRVGLLGALVQTALIIYLGVASFVGLYTLPVLERLRPVAGATPFFKIMLNCMVLLILSSALPLFTRTVGITTFDLFGNFGQIVWTRNYHLVLVYNFAFLVALAFCLCHSIVFRLSKECFNRCRLAVLWTRAALVAAREWLLRLKEDVVGGWLRLRLRLLSFVVGGAKVAKMEDENDELTDSSKVTSNGHHNHHLKAKPSSELLTYKALFANTLHTSVAFLYSALHLREVQGADGVVGVGSPIKEAKDK